MDWRSRLLDIGIRLRGGKRRMSSAELTRKHIAEVAARPPAAAPPARIAKRVDIASRTVDGVTVYDVAPPADREPVAAVFYLHGGAYTYEIEPTHWQFIAQLARQVPARVRVPVYRLAPATTAAVTVPAMVALLEQFAADAGADQVTVMGDSAGGGLALAAAQQLRDAGGPRVARLVLISPWLDVTVSDPRQAQIVPRDRMLGIAGLAECGRLYAGDLDPRDPRVSPLYGDLRGLPPIDVFAGTDDLLYIDALRLVERCRAVEQPVQLHEAEGQPHVYPLLPLIEEGRQARRRIVELTRG